MQNLANTVRERPLGVTVIATLVAIQGILEIILGVVTIVSRVSFIGWGALIVGLIMLYFSWGLWTLKPWAYVVTIVISIINLVGAFIALFNPYDPAWEKVLSMVIPIVILVYFLADEQVRSAFRTEAL